MTLLPALGKAPQLLPTPVLSGSAFDLQGIQTVGYLLALRQSTAPVNEHPKQSNLESVRKLGSKDFGFTRSQKSLCIFKWP